MHSKYAKKQIKEAPSSSKLDDFTKVDVSDKNKNNILPAILSRTGGAFAPKI
jgi:Leucine-rich repeat (LRR) protein